MLNLCPWRKASNYISCFQETLLMNMFAGQKCVWPFRQLMAPGKYEKNTDIIQLNISLNAN